METDETMKIIGIGETVLDIVMKGGQPSAAVPGGSTFNAMISLGRTAGRDLKDVKMVMLTQTGDDMVGDMVRDFLEANNVSSEAVMRIAGTQTTVSLAFLDSGNNACYEFFKDTSGGSDQLAEVSFEPGDIVLFGSFFAINKKLRPCLRRILGAAREAGAVIYYDINFRKNHLKELPSVLADIEENCRMSDFVRGSDEDFGYLYGTRDPETVYREHLAALCPNLICTCGSDPVHVFAPGMHESYPVPDVETVSTIGAGDNFNAGFVYGLAAGGVSRNLSCERWRQLATTAATFSANVCGSIWNYVDKDFKI